MSFFLFILCFFFNDPATTEIYTLSLHDALPILFGWGMAFLWGPIGDKFGRVRTLMLTIVWYSVFTFLSALVTGVWQLRSEEHTSELQSHHDLVCRLLLEKKNNQRNKVQRTTDSS